MNHRRNGAQYKIRTTLPQMQSACSPHALAGQPAMPPVMAIRVTRRCLMAHRSHAAMLTLNRSSDPVGGTLNHKPKRS